MSKQFVLMVFGMWYVVFGLSLAPASAQGLLPECDPTPDAFVDETACREHCNEVCRGRHSELGPILKCSAECRDAKECATMDTSDDCGTTHIIGLLVAIYNWLLGLAALVGILMIIWAGIQMILVSVFEVSPNELMATPLESAKLTLLRAVIGLIIIFLAYVIVNTVLAILGIDASSAVGGLLADYGLLATPPP